MSHSGPGQGLKVSGSDRHSEQPPSPGNALEFVLPAFGELNVRSDHQVLDRRRHEYFARTSKRRYPGSYVNRHPSNIAVANLDLAGVDTSPHVDVESAQRVSDGKGTFDGSTGTVERGYEAVSDCLHLAAPEALDLGADALVVVFE